MCSLLLEVQSKIDTFKKASKPERIDKQDARCILYRLGEIYDECARQEMHEQMLSWAVEHQ